MTTNTAQQSNNDQGVVQEQQPSAKQPVKSAAKTKKSASAFRTISEVADHLEVQQHVLRFWETKFSYVRPLKRGGGRRYYRPEDVALLETIHHLLYTEGYTIKGVQKLLKEKGKNNVVQNNMPGTKAAPAAKEAATMQQQPQKQESTLGKRNTFLLESVLGDLNDLKSILVAKK